MSISMTELGLYVFGLFVLFITPGPVWVALVARVLAGGLKQAWPLTLGVAVGDIFWSVLPGFFDLSNLTAFDALAIAIASFIVPLVGNLGLAYFVDRARRLLSSPKAIGRMNKSAGFLLIFVGVVIFFI